MPAAKKILINGGVGFIGYHLSKKLLDDGHDVVIYDAFINYIPADKSTYALYLHARLADLDKRVEIIRGDIKDVDHLIKTIKEHRPEVLINLAAVPIATASNEMPWELIEVNLEGTIAILDAIRSTDSVRRFVYTSSSFVYGNFKKEPADENHITEPIDIYGGTKLAGEILTKTIGKKFGIEYTIIRPSAVYGPTDANRRVTQIFVENALSGKPLILHDGGSGRLDFSCVMDVADGFALAALSPKARNETFNITCGEGRSMRSFAEILQRLVPGVKIIERPSDDIRPERGALDISKARRLLGYNPKYPLEKGMEEYVRYVKDSGILSKL
ncbi:MAG: NAD-dependent epimerase/dehydratase family protein [Pseudomonadota bacterium]